MLNDVKVENVGVSCVVERRKEENKMWGLLKLESLILDSKNIARIVPGRIISALFFPSCNVKMIVAGSKFGNLRLWDFDSVDDEGTDLKNHCISA